MKILMVAAENDAIVGAKVGGIGDVVRDIPQALANLSHSVDIVIPSYGLFASTEDAMRVATLEVAFGDHLEAVDVYKVIGKQPHPLVAQWVLDHPLFAAGGVGNIYCDDPNSGPYATDASKFALFSTAVAQAIMDNVFDDIDVIHLHDWHVAILAVLRAYDPRYAKLQSILTVYTVHNMALQGVRPLAGDESSLQAWFPALAFDIDQIGDPRFTDCVNLMAAGINLSDKVHAVSPTYAREILLPSHPQLGYFGGEGLHTFLQRANQQGRLHGILNGCEYPQHKQVSSSLKELLLLCEKTLLLWMAEKPQVDSSHLIAIRRLALLRANFYNVLDTRKNDDGRPFVVTSVGRITDQKFLLLQQVMDDGRTALDHLLAELGDSSVLIVLGSGDSELEHILIKVSARNENFIFLNGYSDELSRSLYCSGDLFLMPSSFEPCGISQMLAMREGQPCLVHSVGGLSDTVDDGVNGFAFTGINLHDQADNMIGRFKLALQTQRKKPKQWQKIVMAASRARFLWSDVAKQYLVQLYDSARNGKLNDKR